MVLPINVSPNFKGVSTLSTFIPSFLVLPSVHTIWSPILPCWSNSLQNHEWKIAKSGPWACMSPLQHLAWFFMPSFWKSFFLGLSQDPTLLLFLSSFLVIKNTHWSWQGAEDFLFIPALGMESRMWVNNKMGFFLWGVYPGVLTLAAGAL